jgi:hypothetical protein
MTDPTDYEELTEEELAAEEAKEKAAFAALLNAVRQHGETHYLIVPKREEALPRAKTRAAAEVVAKLLVALLNDPDCPPDRVIGEVNDYLESEDMELVPRRGDDDDEC